MKIGRNDPCPCGSGKKYKKCCLAQEEEAARESHAHNHDGPSVERARALAESVSEMSLHEPPVDPPDPAAEARHALLDAFEEQDYEGRFRLFYEAIDGPDFLDSELAFEMLNHLSEEVPWRGDHGRFNGLMEHLGERRPDIYADEEAFLLDWWIENALVLGQANVVAEKGRRFAEIANRDIDLFNRMIDRLSYHDYRTPLVESMRIAWPNVKESVDIMGWAVDESLSIAVEFEIFDVLEGAVEAGERKEELRRRLGHYADNLNADLAVDIMKRISGETTGGWRMDDFTASSLEVIARNIVDLCREFLGHLRRDGGVAFTRGALGSREIADYLVRRNAGRLEPRESMFDSVLGRGRKRKKREPKMGRPRHPLCPCQVTLGRFTSNLMNFVNPQNYKAVACIETIPAWLDFLESQGLIDEATHARGLADIRPLCDNLKKSADYFSFDPMLKKAVEAL